MLLLTYLSFRLAGGKNYVTKITLSAILISILSTIPFSPLWYIFVGPVPFLSFPAYSLVDKVWAPDYGYSQPSWMWVHKIKFLTITLASASVASLNLPFDYFSRTILYFLLVNFAGTMFGAMLGYWTSEKRGILHPTGKWNLLGLIFGIAILGVASFFSNLDVFAFGIVWLVIVIGEIVRGRMKKD